MAVTINAAGLRAALRLADDTDGNADAVRLLAVASALVEGYAPGAPATVSNEAATRCAGYLLTDVPEIRPFMKLTLGEGMLEIEPRAVGSALRLSGAMSLLSSWRTRRAGGLT